MKAAHIDQYKNLFSVQPICDVLAETDAPIAPSTYYAAHTRPPSTRRRRDEDALLEHSEAVLCIPGGQTGRGMSETNAILRVLHGNSVFAREFPQ